MSSRADTSTSPQARKQGTKLVATTVEHPRLTNTDASSVRSFPRLYDQYSKEIEERARQLLVPDTLSTEAVSPVHLKFLVDADWIEYVIELGFIADVSSYDTLTDEHLRTYLDKQAEESKEVVTIYNLDKLVEYRLHIDMKDSDARSQIKNLFVSYKTLLRSNGLSWLTKEN